MCFRQMANQLSNIYPTTSCWHHVFIQPHKQPVADERWQKIACGRWSCFLSWCSFRYIMWISRKLVLLVFTYNISQYICWYSGYFCCHLVQRCTQWLQMLSVPSQDKQAMQRLLEASGWTNGWTALGETCRTHVDLCGFKMLDMSWKVYGWIINDLT